MIRKILIKFSTGIDNRKIINHANVGGHRFMHSGKLGQILGLSTDFVGRRPQTIWHHRAGV